jgi:predicted membrane chloride channel (bestrophin family)
MIQYDPDRWFDHLFDVKGSLILEITPIEIEDPFGQDLNDPALEDLCAKIAKNLLAPCGHHDEADAHQVETGEIIRIGVE